MGVAQQLIDAYPARQVILFGEIANAHQNAFRISHRIAIENMHRSRGSPQQTEDVLDERRLTRAVGADEPENRSARHSKAHVIERHLGAKAARYILDLDHGLH